MKIVHPLSGKAITAHFGSLYDAWIIEITFCNSIKRSAKALFNFSDLLMHELPDMHRTHVIYLVNGIESKTIKMKLLKPIDGIFGKKFLTPSLQGPSKLIALPHGVL